MFKKSKPYNELPLLPTNQNIQTQAVLKKVNLANKALAELKGLIKSIPNPKILLNTFTIMEAKASSEIENIYTVDIDLHEAFTSRKKVNDAHIKEILQYREALEHGYNQLCYELKALKDEKFAELSGVNKDELFNLELLSKIAHTFTKITEKTRSEEAVIKTDNNKKYCPPSPEYIEEKLDNLLQYIHSEDNSIDSLIKLAIIHYQFLAIYPFSDGNGRTARILNILFLVYKELLDFPVIYLSKFIIDNKKEYNKKISDVTLKNKWEDWILFMLEAIEKSAIDTKNKVEKIRLLIEKTTNFARRKLPEVMYSKDIIELIFFKPYSKRKYLINAGFAKDWNATIYLDELVKIGILEKRKVGTENLYLNVELYEILKQF